MAMDDLLYTWIHRWKGSLVINGDYYESVDDVDYSEYKDVEDLTIDFHGV